MIPHNLAKQLIYSDPLEIFLKPDIKFNRRFVQMFLAVHSNDERCYLCQVSPTLSYSRDRRFSFSSSFEIPSQRSSRGTLKEDSVYIREFS